MKVKILLSGILVGALLLVSLLFADPIYIINNGHGLLWAASQPGDLDGDGDVDQDDLNIRGRIAPRGARPSTGPEKRSAPRAGQRLGGAVARRWRPPARSLRDRNRL